MLSVEEDSSSFCPMHCVSNSRSPGKTKVIRTAPAQSKAIHCTLLREMSSTIVSAKGVEDFLRKPHTISLLLALLAYFLYAAVFSEAGDSLGLEANLKRGFAVASVCFLLIGVLIFNDGPLIRPHPAFWRIILGLSILYQFCLTILLFQTKGDARRFFAFVDSTLGVQLPERSYAEQCGLTWQVIWNQMDLFVIAHLLGWYVKALLFRDYWLCWVISLMFEAMEYSLEHQLPNFAECWWDHWILDVATCNAVGIWLGMKTCEYLKMKKYCWRGISSIPTYKGKIKRSIQQFTPHSFSSFDWAPNKSLKNYLGVLFVIASVLQCEVNHFYLKYLLWIPPEHWLNPARLVLFAFMCAPCIHEIHSWLFDPTCPKLGPHAWLLLANIWTETIICLKYSKGEFPASMPRAVKIFWATLTFVVTGYAILRFGILKHRKID